MRAIKFRVWDKEINSFIRPWAAGLRFELDTGNIYENGTNTRNDYILMQYTGLKDINGKEIYEGDIIYLAGYGDYLCEFPFLDLYDAAHENDIGAIVGNIYENPELMEGME